MTDQQPRGGQRRGEHHPAGEARDVLAVGQHVRAVEPQPVVGTEVAGSRRA